MPTYQPGHIKWNPETGEVALKTVFPEDQGPQLASLSWLIATKSMGSRSVTTDQVESWDDLYTPPEPEPVVPTQVEVIDISPPTGS